VAEALEVLHVVSVVAPDQLDEGLGGGQGAHRSRGDPILLQDWDHRSAILKETLFSKLHGFRVVRSVNMAEETKVP
jgi:hypothetical protein